MTYSTEEMRERETDNKYAGFMQEAMSPPLSGR